MVNKTTIEFGFRIIWRIMEISEGVQYPPRPTPQFFRWYSAASSNFLIIHPHETSLVVGLSRGTISFDILCLNEIWIFAIISVWKGLERLSLSPFLLGYLTNSPYKKSTFGPV